MSWKFAVSAERRVCLLDGSQSPSGSPGVEVTLRGWQPGCNKVRLTRTLRQGGMRLEEAVRATGALLEERDVRVRLGQFATVAAARSALQAIGVRRVEAA